MTNSDAALLIVDDNEDNRYTLTRRLSREGYQNITTANNGREALERLTAQPFDLVLLDVMMPDMNGYEVLEHVENQRLPARCPDHRQSRRSTKSTALSAVSNWRR